MRRLALVRFALLALFACVLCIACTQQPSNAQPAVTVTAAPTPDPSTLLAQAQQADAPALAFSGANLIATWIGTDERGVHQDARLITPDEMSATVTLPLPPTHPYAQRLVPGANGSTHLLWLDADTTGQTALYSALLARDLTVVRGPIGVSEGLATAYSVVQDGAGGVWTAWSGGMSAEMALYARRSDSDGRPLETQLIAARGEHPALARTSNGEIWLFWLANGGLMRQKLASQNDAGEPGEAQMLTGTISLAAGDQLVNTRAAPDGDGTSAYFFWNMARANGVNETWWTWGRLDANAWRQPTRLTSEAGAPFGWAEPAAEPNGLAAAAVESADGLGIMLISGGEVVGHKLIAAGALLIGMPALAADASGDFALGWAAPGDTTADLRLLRVAR